MEIEELTPHQAYELLVGDADAVYLDVRTEREFEQGHPEGAYNIPVLFLQPGQPAQPNTEFAEVVRRSFSLERTLVVGCQSGVRSMKACAILASHGFHRIVNVRGGFGGARDRSGEVLAVGWQETNLPVSTQPQPGRSHAELKA